MTLARQQGSTPSMPALGKGDRMILCESEASQLASSRADGATERKPVSEKKKENRGRKKVTLGNFAGKQYSKPIFVIYNAFLCLK